MALAIEHDSSYWTWINNRVYANKIFIFAPISSSTRSTYEVVLFSPVKIHQDTHLEAENKHTYINNLGFLQHPCHTSITHPSIRTCGRREQHLTFRTDKECSGTILGQLYVGDERPRWGRAATGEEGLWTACFSSLEHSLASCASSSFTAAGGWRLAEGINWRKVAVGNRGAGRGARRLGSAAPAAARLLQRRPPAPSEGRETRCGSNPRVDRLGSGLDLKFYWPDLNPIGNKIQVRSSRTSGQTGPPASWSINYVRDCKTKETIHLRLNTLLYLMLYNSDNEWIHWGTLIPSRWLAALNSLSFPSTSQ
jgi:hypothetical protein